MKININNFIKKSIYFISVYMILVNFVCDFFKLPTIIRYIPDIMIPIYIIYIIGNYKNIVQKNKVLPRIILFFLIHCIVGCVININKNSLFYFFWGFRNLFRFLIIALCILNVFENEDVSKYLKILHKLFYINIIVCAIQYFILGYWGDAIGGTFRLGDTGGNAGLICILLIENILNINDFMNRKCSLVNFLISLGCTIAVTVIAELKIMYIYLILITITSILLNRFSKKTVLIVMGIVVMLNIGYKVLEQLDPITAKGLNIEALMEYAGGESHGYSSKYDISRMRAFSQINEIFFKDNSINKIWGYGLGNCDVSSAFNIFNSIFAEKYNDKLHYTWFTHAMLYLETGIVGYLLYINLFVYVAYYCLKNRKKDYKNFSFYNSIVMLSILLIVMTFYNSVLRNDSSYFVYTCLILALILNVKNSEQQISCREGEK